MPAGSTTVLRDPVHGDIELTREELQLVDTFEFQRLRGIKQLGSASLVYTGAVHTRFDHSIGTVHTTSRLIAAANKNAARDPAGCHRVTAEEERVLRFAALLHDVTHVPYGHNIEDQSGLLERHDVPERFRRVLGDTELGGVLDGLGARADVLAILTGEGRVPAFWRQLLSDTIDADLLDYLRRDAYYTGLALRYDDRVYDPFRVDRASQRLFVDCEKGGMLREDIVSELMRLLEIRYHFSERVYYHHAKIAAGALVARLVEGALVRGLMTVEELQRSTDESLVSRLEHADLGDLRPLVDRLRRRRLPKRVAVLPMAQNRDVQDELLRRFHAAPEQRDAWEREVEAEVAAQIGRPAEVMLYSPARDMQLKEARTLVRFPDAPDLRELCEFEESLPRLRDLRDSYPRLWKLYVLTPEPDPQVRRRMQEVVMAHLPDGAVNALRL